MRHRFVQAPHGVRGGLVSLLLCLGFLFSADVARADRVVFNNGQVLEGTIVSESSTHITVRTPLQVEIPVKLSDVARIEREVMKSVEEQEGDNALIEERFDDALRRYHGAADVATSDEDKARIAEKIAEVESRVVRRDMARIESSFRDFDKILQGGNWQEAQRVLDEVAKAYAKYPLAQDAIRKRRALVKLARCRSALDSVNPVLAEQLLRETLELDPDLLEAHLLAVDKVYRDRSDRREESLAHLKQAIRLGEGILDEERLLDLKYRLAEIEFRREEYEEALELYAEIKEKALTRYPRAVDREIECLSVLGERFLTQTGDIDKAIERYRDAIERNPNHPKVRLLRRRLGELYLAKIPPDPALALQQFEALRSESQEETADLFYLIARCYIAQGQVEPAIESLEKEIAVNKANYNAWIDLARLYMDSKQFSKADRCLADAIEVKPDSIDAPLLIGRLRRLQERYAEAKSSLDRVLAQEPEHREARLLLGQVLLEEEELNQAAKYFDAILRDMNGDPETMSRADRRMMAEALVGRGRVDLDNKQLRLALSRFVQAREVMPDLADTHFYIGESRRQLGNFGEAEENFLKALELDPTDPDLHLALGILYHNNLNRHEAAIEEYYKYFEMGGLDYGRVNRWLEELGAKPVPQETKPAGTTGDGDAAADEAEGDVAAGTGASSDATEGT